MVYDWEFSNRIKCSDREKRECAQVAAQIITYAEKARRQGLLALEDDLQNIDLEFLRNAFQMIVDGIDPDFIRRMLEIRIFSGAYRGRELLVRCIAMEGVLGMQQGDHPRSLKAMLGAFFGDEFHFDRWCEQPSQQSGVEPNLEKLKGQPASVAASADFDESILGLDNRTIQMVLREVDQPLLTQAIKGSSGDAQIKLFRNMSKRAVTLLREDMDYLDPVEDSVILNAQNHIMNVIERVKSNNTS